MLKITHSAKQFFEKAEGPIAVYGTDNAGFWIGYYMNQCGIDLWFYLTDSVVHEELYLNGKHVYSLERLKNYKNAPLRVVITSERYVECVNRLMDEDEENDLDLMLIVPVYPPIWKHQSGLEYNINRFLGYFRRLLIADIPTIISNDCTAGRIYELLGTIVLSPTVNLSLSYFDFLKVCKDPKRYFSEKACDGKWGKAVVSSVADEFPVYRLGDVAICFAHENSSEGLPERWESLCELINWDNLVFMLTDNKFGTIPLGVLEKFEQIDNIRKIVLYKTGTIEKLNGDAHTVYMNDFYFSKVNDPIENHFDIIGWINGLTKKEGENE